MKKTTIFLILLNTVCYLFSQNYQMTWQQCYGGEESDKARDITLIFDGYFIVGNTLSSNGDISFNHGSSDIWLIKTDSIGNIIWEKTYGGSESEGCQRIIPDGDGNYFLIGGSNSADGDISNDPFPDTWDYWIAKIDNNGNIIWEKIVGGNGDETLWTGTVTNDGGIVAFGWSGSEYGDVSINYGLYDMWMIKLNSDGDIEWDFTLGTDWQDYGQAIIQTSDGGFLVGGSSKLTGGGNLDCDNHGQADAVLIKLDSLRNIEWQHCYGGSDYEGVNTIIELNDGYLISCFTHSDDGDVTGYHGEADIWILKIDLYGNIIWEQCFGGNKGETAYHISTNSNDEFTVIGYTKSNNGDVSGNHSLNEYDTDLWMYKLSNNGELLWQRCFGGEGSEATPGLSFGVIKKSDNNFVIAAQTDYGPSYDVHCTPHGGFNDEDYWLFELKDCAYYAPATPATLCGADTACSAGGAATVYTVAPAQNAWSYEWQLLPETAGTINGDSTTATVNWAENYEGAAVITVRSQNDCGQSAWSEPKYTQVQTCLGTEEIPAETTALRVYPNPAKDWAAFNYTLPNNKTKGVIKIVDTKGVFITSFTITGKAGQKIWDTRKLKPGIYFYTLNVSEYSRSGKIVISK